MTEPKASPASGHHGRLDQIFDTDIGTGLNIDRRAFAVKQQPRANSDRPPAILPTISIGMLSICGSWTPARLSSTPEIGIQTMGFHGFQQVLQDQLPGVKLGFIRAPVLVSHANQDNSQGSSIRWSPGFR
jgi:hypothetical protein